MIIEINKDIESYKESVFFGLSAKQTISAALTIIIGGGAVLLLYPVLGIKLSAYVAVPIAAPIAMSGFYSINGMSFFEVWKRRFKMLFFNKGLAYKSVEEKQKADEEHKSDFVERRRKGAV